MESENGKSSQTTFLHVQSSKFSFPQLRMAALNEPFTGNLQGMRNADLNCHRQARRAGLMGTFKAFLSARFEAFEEFLLQCFIISSFLEFKI